MVGGRGGLALRACCRPCAAPSRWRTRTPATRCTARSGPISRSACAGSTSCRRSASARASPTTWGSGRPSRCWPPARSRSRAHVRSANGERRPSLIVAPASLLANWAAEAARFAPGLSVLVAHPSAMPAAQLKTIDPRREHSRPTSSSRRMARCARSLDLDVRLAPRRRRRGASHQEPGGEADARREGAAGAGPHRVDRHADREPPRRPVVDLRLPQPGAARIGQAVHRAHQSASPTGRTTLTARCATWCGRTSCGA